jgi:hypothetical protein
MTTKAMVDLRTDPDKKLIIALAEKLVLNDAMS